MLIDKYINRYDFQIISPSISSEPIIIVHGLIILKTQIK